MSTVKITELAELINLNQDTEQTLLLGVDLPTQTTKKITAKVLADGLYSNNPLKVGYNTNLLWNAIAQFSDNTNYYSQVNLQNLKLQFV